MKLVVTQRAMKWIPRLLFASGAAMLGYCGFVLTDASIFQTAEARQLEQLTDPQKTAAAKTGIPDVTGLIGRIEVPRLGLSVMVIEGTSTIILRRAAGHITGTALPGQRGNVGISGHRDTFFRPLRNIQRNDIIKLTTLLGEYNYRVVSTKIVSPRDVAVLDSSGGEILTLVTCYPFYFVGSAPERFIVRAERVT